MPHLLQEVPGCLEVRGQLENNGPGRDIARSKLERGTLISIFPRRRAKPAATGPGTGLPASAKETELLGGLSPEAPSRTLMMAASGLEVNMTPSHPGLVFAR